MTEHWRWLRCYSNLGSCEKVVLYFLAYTFVWEKVKEAPQLCCSVLRLFYTPSKCDRQYIVSMLTNVCMCSVVKAFVWSAQLWWPECDYVALTLIILTRIVFCPVAALYAAFNVLPLMLRTAVGQQWYKFYRRVILSPFWGIWRHFAEFWRRGT